MNIIVSHELSKFGKLNIALHAESAVFYEQLESHGLIDYLKNLEHLGFISKSHPGNNHKRWDYIMLQFHLLHKLRDEVFRNGLSSKHKIDDQHQTSGLVILQVAILFANIGHLKGTLSSEIGLLNFLEQNENQKTDFFTRINQSAIWKPFSDNIYKTKDYYKIKYLVALNYLLENNTDPLIEKIVYLFFKNSMIDDDPKLRKLKWIFNKVRQVSFVYLDSFNSDFPFHVDITKILLNTVNYRSVFNPNSFDFDGFYDSCETTLTKKLYISEFASLLLEHNRSSFISYLNKEVTRSGGSKLDLKNFLISLYNRNTKSFEITHPKNKCCFQFYLSKEDIEFFGVKQELFNYRTAMLDNYKSETGLNALINKNLTVKNQKISLIHDSRRSMFFNNLILDLNEITIDDEKQFLLNYFNVHKEFIEKFEYVGDISTLKGFSTSYFLKHYSRKVFLQLSKILFKYNHQLSAYIKFDNQQLIHELTKDNRNFTPTGYIKSKASLLDMLNQNISIPNIPNDIKNNFQVARHIVENVSTVKRYVNAFYCLFPIEIDKYELDPSRLYNLQNPETVENITDIDLFLVLFNESKFELYIIEGKDKTSGFISAVKKDFNERILPNLRYPSNYSSINIVSENNAKGGYIKICN